MTPRLAFCALFLLLPEAALADIGLYPSATLPVGDSEYDIVSAPVGSDPDLFVARVTGNALVWLHNDGNGAFPSPVSFPESGPIALETVDVDGDGRRDLLSANWGDGSASVRIQSAGSPAFGAQPTRYSITGPGGAKVRDLHAVDLDGDLVRDLAVLSVDGRMYVRRGIGGGAFSARVDTVVVGGESRAFVVGDLDADGRPDLVVTDRFAEGVRILLGTGPLTFAPPVALPTGQQPCDVVLADFDADGDPDLAVANEISFVTTFVNDGTGHFGGKRSFLIGNFTESIVADDMDQDGDLDLLAANFALATVWLFENPGDGVLALETVIPTAPQPRAVTTLDLDGDGRPDVATANDVPGNVSILRNVAAAGDLFEACDASSLVTADAPAQVVTADLDGDGDHDLATANESGSVSVWLRNAGGVFGARTDLAAGPGTSSLAAGDLDGDGLPELVAADPNASQVRIWRNAGGGSYSAGPLLFVGPRPVFVTVADLNGDGRNDLATANAPAGGTGSVTILFNLPGTTLFPVLETVLGSDTPPTEATPLAAGSPLPLGAGPVRVDIPTGPPASMLVVGELNGDGRPDLVVANDAKLPMRLVLSQGTGTWRTPTTMGSAGRWVALADLSGDGRLDLAIADPSWSAVRTCVNEGGSNFPLNVFLPNAVGPDPRAVAIADLEGDGGKDLVWINRDGVTGGLKRIQNAYVSAIPCLAGNDGRSIAVAPRPGGGADVFTLLAGDDAIVWRSFGGSPLIARPAGLARTNPGFRLEPAAPNPSRDGGTIAFTLPARASVRVGVYDVRGRQLATLADGTWDPGRHALAWDGTDPSGRPVGAGLYFYRLVSPFGTRVERQVRIP